MCEPRKVTCGDENILKQERYHSSTLYRIKKDSLDYCHPWTHALTAFFTRKKKERLSSFLLKFLRIPRLRKRNNNKIKMWGEKKSMQHGKKISQ